MKLAVYKRKSTKHVLLKHLDSKKTTDFRWLSDPSLRSKFNRLTSVHSWRVHLEDIHNCAYQLRPICLSVFRIQILQEILMGFYEILNGFTKYFVNISFLFKANRNNKRFTKITICVSASS